MNTKRLKASIKNHVLPAVAVGCIVVAAGTVYYVSKKNLLEINDASMQALRDGKCLVMKMDGKKIFGSIYTP